MRTVEKVCSQRPRRCGLAAPPPPHRRPVSGCELTAKGEGRNSEAKGSLNYKLK